MNIINKLTLRHLKLNKRRTLVTIVGVIISVAMITAVATISTSFLNLLQRDAIASDGEWHVRYNDVTQAQVDAIRSDEATKALILSNDAGYAMLEGSQNRSKPYLFVKEYNTAGFEHFPIKLMEGRLPQADNEIVISAEIAQTAKVKYGIGEQLTLDIGRRVSQEQDETINPTFGQYDSLQKVDGELLEELEPHETKSYTIVGVIERPGWEPTWAPGYTVITYTDDSLLGDNETIHASVVVKKVKKSLYSHSEKLASEIGMSKERVSYNNSLLRYYGVTNNDGLNAMLYSLSAVIMSIIMIGSVSLIYNAFAISVSERSRHLGMLSSIGATRWQKRNSVFFEGAVIGLISIPLGIASGLAGIAITFMFINTMEGALGLSGGLVVTVTPMSIVIACVVSMLTIFISTYMPARRASKVSAIDAIRQSTDVKLTGKAVKTSRLVRKLFGFEAEIGLKNLKRNKRRYQATVFSLVISILLFLTVSYFTDNLKKSVQLSQDGVNYDIELTSRDKELDASFAEAVASLQEVSSSSDVKETMIYSWVAEDKLADPLKKMAGTNELMLEDGKLRHNVFVFALDEQSLKDYASQTGANAEELMDPSASKAIIVNKISYKDEVAKKYVETEVLHAAVGDSLSLHSVDWDTEAETPFGDVKIAAFTDQQPPGAYSYGLSNVNIVVSKPVFEKLLEQGQYNNVHIEHSLFLKSSDPMKTQQNIEELNAENDYYLRNVFKYRQQEEQMLLIMSVFTYGFIFLITAISIANIFNTISTSISLRKREFAMLKSVGMTPKGFNKMINYESIFYGIKSLAYGLPISIVVMVLIYRSMMNSFSFAFELPWLSLLYVVVAVFIIVGLAMMYSSSKVKRENIIDAIKQESI